LRAAGLALQQYPSVPPALQGVDTLFTSAGDHLGGAMDDWAGGVDDQDGAQLNNAAVGLQRFLAELSAAAPAFTSMVQCFSR
jgi:ABC-type transporter Mla subunit MlaD